MTEDKKQARRTGAKVWKNLLFRQDILYSNSSSAESPDVELVLTHAFGEEEDDLREKAEQNQNNPVGHEVGIDATEN